MASLERLGEELLTLSGLPAPAVGLPDNHLGNLTHWHLPKDNSYLVVENSQPTRREDTMPMIGLSPTELAIAGAGLAIAALLFAAVFKRKPKRAEKWEKAAIMKQLLALSEQEDSRRVAQAATPARTQTQSSTARSSQARPTTAGKSVAATAKAR